MKKVMLLLIIVLFIGAGCKSGTATTSDIFIKDTEHVAVPPVIIDSGKAFPEYILPILPSDALHEKIIDSVFRYVKLNAHKDTVIDIKYIPKTNWLYYKVQPDTVRIHDRDTLRNVTLKPVIEQTPLLSKIGIFALGAVFIVIAGIILFFVTQKKTL